MSKKTSSGELVKPLLLGSLMVAATAVTAAALLRWWKDLENAESVLAHCERTLAELGTRTSLPI